MSSKQWIVGYFQKENKYSVIPFTWILNSDTLPQLSKWPMFGVVNSMIMDATFPGSDWPTFPVKLVSQIFYTYEDAKMKERELVCAPKPEVKNKRKSKNVYPAQIEAESVSAYSNTYTTPIKVMKTNHVVDHQQRGSSTRVEQPMNRISNELLPSNIISNSMDTLYDTVWINTDNFIREMESPLFDSNTQSMGPPVTNVSTENNQELKDLFKNAISVLAHVKQLVEKIDSLIKNNNNARINQSINSDFENIFPIKYVESMNAMENKLKLDEYTSNQLINLMQKIGGNDIKNFVKRVSERLFTNELTTKYSWAGFRDNQKLRNLKIIKIMKNVAVSTFSDTENNVEKEIKNWFRHGSRRYAREQQTESSKKTHHIINVPELPIQCAALL